MIELVRADEIEALNISQAARATRLARDTIRHHVELWESSGHRIGIPSFRVGARRLIRRAALRDWMVALERREAWS